MEFTDTQNVGGSWGPSWLSLPWGWDLLLLSQVTSPVVSVLIIPKTFWVRDPSEVQLSNRRPGHGHPAPTSC